MSTLITGLMPGVSGMANVHPLLVHLPIGLFLGFLLAEALGLMTRRESLRQAASWMLYFGTLGAAATVATGLWAASTVEHDEAVHAIMERHETYGMAVLAIASLLSLWRMLVGARFSTWGRVSHFLGALVLMATLSLGADLGGMMVYGHGVGVTLPPAETVPAPSAAAHARDGIALPPAVRSSQPEAPLPLQQAPPEMIEHPHTHDHSHGHKHTHKH